MITINQLKSLLAAMFIAIAILVLSSCSPTIKHNKSVVTNIETHDGVRDRVTVDSPDGGDFDGFIVVPNGFYQIGDTIRFTK